MDLLKPLVRHITIPVFDRREGKVIKPYLDEFEKSQYFSAERIRDIQLEKLKRILAYANNHTEFYRDRFADCGFNPDDLNSLADLNQIPILTKDDIRANKDRIISDQYKTEDMIYKRTGGSTSVPLKLYVDLEAGNQKTAATIRHNRWANYDRGDKLASIWGDTDKPIPFKERVYNTFNTRAIYLDTLLMNTEYNLNFIKKMRQFKPKALMGHAHSIYQFACFVEEHGIGDLGLKGIISTAEILYDHERAKIEKVFGKILFNRYGCEELSIIATECEAHDGLHVFAEGLYVEVVDGDSKTPGRLVITDLLNRGMPFIRYEIGDMATTIDGDCPCGRGLPRLGKIYGRTADFLYTPDGRSISGISVLDTFTIHVPGVKQVQIIQNEIDLLNFKVVRAGDFNDDSLAVLKSKIPQFFGEQMRYNIEYVDRIEQTERGKYRFSICNLENKRV